MWRTVGSAVRRLRLRARRIDGPDGAGDDGPPLSDEEAGALVELLGLHGRIEDGDVLTAVSRHRQKFPPTG